MTDDQINKIIREHATITDQNLYGAIYMMMLAAVDAEREACAKVCDFEVARLHAIDEARPALAVGICAAAIRARGNT